MSTRSPMQAVCVQNCTLASERARPTETRPKPRTWLNDRLRLSLMPATRPKASQVSRLKCRMIQEKDTPVCVTHCNHRGMVCAYSLGVNRNNNRSKGCTKMNNKRFWVVIRGMDGEKSQMPGLWTRANAQAICDAWAGLITTECACAIAVVDGVTWYHKGGEGRKMAAERQG